MAFPLLAFDLMPFLRGVGKALGIGSYISLETAFLLSLMALRKGDGIFLDGKSALKLSRTATVVPKLRLRSSETSEDSTFFFRGVPRTFTAGGAALGGSEAFVAAGCAGAGLAAGSAGAASAEETEGVAFDSGCAVSAVKGGSCCASLTVASLG